MTRAGESGDSATMHHPGQLLVGTFRFHLDGQRWEWSDAVARMHGHLPGTITPTTELILAHKHPDDRAAVSALLDQVRRGAAVFSSRHRIVDTAGCTHTVVVVGDRMLDGAGRVLGTRGFYVDVTAQLDAQVRAAANQAVAAALDSRAQIDQVKGILMYVYGLSAEQAFDLLVWRSQQSNTKVRDLARGFLDRIATEAPPQPDRIHIDRILLSELAGDPRSVAPSSASVQTG